MSPSHQPSEHLLDVASFFRQKPKKTSTGEPYLAAGRFQIVDDAGLVARLPAHEHALIRRLSGIPGVGKPRRLGDVVEIPVRPDALPVLAKMGRP